MNDETISRVAHPRREIPGENPEVARLSAMVVALLGELAIVRERLDTVERVADAAGAFPRADVEAYRASGDAEKERDVIRRRLIEVVMQPVRLEAERAVAAVRSREPASSLADEILAQE